MDRLPILILTWQQAADALEDAASTDPNPILKAICRDVRLWVEALQRLEEADDDALILFLEQIFLRRKGVVILGYVSSNAVREILRAKGFARLAQERSNEAVVPRMEGVLLGPDIQELLAKIERQIPEPAAREIVEDAGLVWPEDKET